MRIDEVPITSLTNRTASAQASAAKDATNCKRILASVDSSMPLRSTSSYLPRQKAHQKDIAAGEEVVREVGYARQHGIDRFAALAPNSPYGHLMADALQAAASASGGTVTKVEFYDPAAADGSPAIQRLMPGGAVPGDAAPASAAPPAPSFEALLLPEGGVRLKRIARQVRMRVAMRSRCGCSAEVSGTSPTSAASRRSSAAGSPHRRRKRGRISSGGTARPTVTIRRAWPRSAMMRRRSPRCGGRASKRGRGQAAPSFGMMRIYAHDAATNIASSEET
jgi:substrate-binding family protein